MGVRVKHGRGRGALARRRIEELHRLKGEFAPRGQAARRKLALLRSLRRAVFARAEDLVLLHDALLFLRAYPDNAAILREVERQLQSFAPRVAAYKKRSGDAAGEQLADTGIVDSAVSNVFSHELTSALSRWCGARVDIDWDAYNASTDADALSVFAPLVSWCEADAIDNDDDFDPQAWLQLSRGRRDATGLAALLTLLRASGLPRGLARALYERAEIPVKWDLAGSPASRTLKRLPFRPVHFQRGPFIGRTKDLRADLHTPAAPLRRLSPAKGAAYVRAIMEVLGARCRELFPLIHANPDEVYLYEPGRGVQIVIYGDQPEVRLPLESNFGAMLLRNGLPVGYGVGAMLFERAEIAINIFPSYRGGESSYIIEQFFRLFVRHFGARVLLVRSYQVGDDNEEALESGAFWFYYKLGFRPVRARVRALAEREAARLQAAPAQRSSLATLKRLAKSDVFFHLDAGRMASYDELRVADLGYAVTRRIAREFGGDRRAAECGAVGRIARVLKIRGWDRWTADEITGFHRLAPLLVCIPGLAAWPPEEKRLLVRAIRAKGSACERNFALLTNRLPRLAAALRSIARAEARRRGKA